MAASTTLIPFTDFPECVYSCGPLYDANGACVPPGLGHTAPASAYTDCFCMDSRVSGLSYAATGICDDACVGTTTALDDLRSWFLSACDVDTATQTTATTSTASSYTSSSKSKKVYGSWLEGHWRWVVAIVVVIVLIVGTWVGACIWRRRYLRRKDRMYELGKGIPSAHFIAQDARSAEVPPATESSEKPSKKWRVLQRT